MSKRILAAIVAALTIALATAPAAEAKPRPKAKVVKVTKAKPRVQAPARPQYPVAPPATCPATPTPPAYLVNPAWGTVLKFDRRNEFPDSNPAAGNRAAVGYRGPYVVFTLACSGTITQFVYKYEPGSKIPNWM